MKKLSMVGLLAVFVLSCTKPEINADLENYGTKKSESVNSKGDGSEYEHDNSEN